MQLGIAFLSAASVLFYITATPQSNYYSDNNNGYSGYGSDSRGYGGGYYGDYDGGYYGDYDGGYGSQGGDGGYGPDEYWGGNNLGVSTYGMYGSPYYGGQGGPGGQWGGPNSGYGAVAGFNYDSQGGPAICLVSNSPISPSSLQLTIQKCAGVGCNPDSTICIGGLDSTAQVAVGCACVNAIGAIIGAFGITSNGCDPATSVPFLDVGTGQTFASTYFHITAIQGSQSVYTLSVAENNFPFQNFNGTYTIDQGISMPSCYGSVDTGISVAPSPYCDEDCG